MIADADVAEMELIAFTSRRTCEHILARLIVWRIKRLNPASVPPGQNALFAQYRYHTVFTDSPLPMLAAEATHRDPAIVEQVIAELKAGPLAHLPSEKFTINAAWLVLPAMAFNLTRVAGGLAGILHAKTRTATIRAQRINVPARIATSARRLCLPAPTADLALADRLRAAVHSHPRTTGHGRGLTTQPGAGHEKRPTWKSRTGRWPSHAHHREPFHRPRSQHRRTLIGGSRLSGTRRQARGRPRDHGCSARRRLGTSGLLRSVTGARFLIGLATTAAMTPPWDREPYSYPPD